MSQEFVRRMQVWDQFVLETCFSHWGYQPPTVPVYQTQPWEAGAEPRMVSLKWRDKTEDKCCPPLQTQSPESRHTVTVHTGHSQSQDSKFEPWGPDGLRPNTLPLGHGGSPQYWIFQQQWVGTSKQSLWWGFSCFFRIYVNLWYTAIKDIFFSVCLFFLLTITGRNEAIL